MMMWRLAWSEPHWDLLDRDEEFHKFREEEWSLLVRRSCEA